MSIKKDHLMETPAEGAASFSVSRRQFLAGLGALTLAVSFKGPVALAAEQDSPLGFVPNAFIRVGKDGLVTVISSYLEMGQGTFTGIATLAAEELDIRSDQLKVEAAPADVKDYANPVLAAIGFVVQGTGGSTAMRGAWDTMRKAAASARLMLLQAAAKTWKVDVASLTVKDGVISHAGSGKSAGYGDFVALASTLPLPDEASVKLKDSAAFTKIGKRDSMARVDIPAKVNGSAIYTQDIKVPGMLVAVIAHPPTLFAKVGKVDASKAKAIAGVEAVLEIPGDDIIQGGVAVLAKNTWIAKQGRDALEITWVEDTKAPVSSEALFIDFKKLGATTGTKVVERGTQPDAVPAGGQEIAAVFELPYLAHAPMEPMNVLIHKDGDSCHVWNGEQWHTADRAAVAKELGLALDKVSITQLYAGGSFGRRANPRCDYVIEGARIVKVAQQQNIMAPIKLVWMREDDMRALQYRPMTVHDTRLVLDKDGNLVSWRWRVVGDSFFGLPTTKVDDNLVEGANDLPYAVPNLLVEQHIPGTKLPVQWMRSVGHTHTGVVGETLIDEAARKAGKDPYQFRRALLKEHPKMLAVLDLVAQKSGWDKPLASGINGDRRSRGIAIRESFNTIVAQVAEVTLKADGSYSVDKVYCAVDCGQVINPGILESQVEGGIGFALSFLRQEITLDKGRIVQGNFNTYPVLRINAMPAVEVYAVPSTEHPTGIGEPGVPPLVPAVINALASLTGKYPRKLPLGNEVDL